VLGIDTLRIGEEARGGEQLVKTLRVELGDSSLASKLKFDGSGVHPLEEAKVKERDAAVREEEEVARMRVARELPVTVEAAKEEAKDDLSDAVTLVSWAVLELLKANPFDELSDEHALACELRDDRWDDDEGMSLVYAVKRALILRLKLIVKLLNDPLTDLSGDRLYIELGRHPLEEAHDHVKVLHVRPDGGSDSWILDLDGDRTPAIAKRSPVHLPNGGGSDRLLLEGAKDVAKRLMKVVFDDLPHLLEGDGGRGVTKLCELMLELLTKLLRDEANVEEGHDLPKLHGGTLHRSKHANDLLRSLKLAPGKRVFSRLLAAGEVGGARAKLLDGLTCGKATDSRSPTDSRRWDLLSVRHAVNPTSCRSGQR
jgi:hypothetical protein